ncbi:MAG: 16S rRNA (cytosine(1402)-N(4))-methyltransferase RsmH [Planctomycetota bacterium]
MPSGHAPVLMDEVVGLLAPEPGGVYVDGTAGLGGHASAIAVLLGPSGRVVLNDLDPGNLSLASDAVRSVEGGPATVDSVYGAFDDLPARLSEMGVQADSVLLDLGFASVQVDDPERGLSFKNDGPLDMRLDPDGPVKAADLVGQLDERDLADVIYRFGEERASRRISRKIVEARAAEPILTTGRLAELVRSALPRSGSRPGSRRGPRIDPATRTFQALRIAVNDEIGRLERLLASIEVESRAVASGGGSWLAPGCRIAIISFHSLEDRPVKQAFRGLVDNGLAEALTRKPLVASDAERDDNPRARSAKLRGVMLLGTED